MSNPSQTAIVTRASQGSSAGLVKAFVEGGFNVVANSRNESQSKEVAASYHVALVEGGTGDPTTAAHIVEKALSRFKSIDVLVTNPGIFFTKPFTDYTPTTSSRWSRRTSKVQPRRLTVGACRSMSKYSAEA